MAPKNENLPVDAEMKMSDGGSITYANEVIAIIAGVAANEVEGIAGMCTSGGISEVFGRNRNITKGVKVEIGSEEASVDLYVVIEYGTPIQTAASNVQENVRKAIETMTGLHVVRVDVHVQGVSFEKEKEEVQAGLASADLPKVTDGRRDAREKPHHKAVKAAEEPKAEEPKAEEPKAEPAEAPAPEAPPADEAAEQPAADA